MRRELLVGGLAAAAALIMTTAGDARACGGCFAPTQSGTVVTDHRMIFSISQTQTTLYDEIEYQGSPGSFAWVLPIHGQVKVRLSADTVFAALDAATQTTIVGPRPTQCPFCGCGELGAASGSSSGGGGDLSGPMVTVISQEVVGPYETVQLSASDPTALNAWLATNGFSIPANVVPVVDAYVHEGFDFLALRLIPGKDVSAMRPVSVTSPGAGLSLPLRMVAAGTGSVVGLTLWVIGDGRYEPANFTQFQIAPGDLTWDFSLGRSNYTTVRSQKETALKNAAWQIESSLSLSPFQIENAVLQSATGSDYLPIVAMDAGAADGGSIAAESADQVRQDDLATLFAAGPQTTRITRMRADLSQAALANDLVLTASQDQRVLSNTYNVTKSVNDVICPPYDPATCGCNGGSSGGGGFGDSGDDAGVEGDGGSGNTAQPRGTQSNCAVAAPGAVGAGGADVEASLVGLLGVALLRTRKRASRRQR